MKNHLTIFLLLVALSGFGQFNERLVVLPGANETSSIHVNGEHIAVVSRVFTDIYTPGMGNRWYTCYTQLDEFGNTINNSVYFQGLTGLFSVEDGYSEDSSLHIQCGLFADSTDIGGAFYVVFNTLGDTARFTTMYNPWYSTDPDYPGTSIMLPRDFYLDEQGYVFMSYGGQSGEFTASDAGVICYGPDDTYQWHIDFIDWEVHQHVFAMTKLNGYLYFALEDQQSTLVVDGVIWLYKVDMQGNVVEVFEEPWETNFGLVRELITDGDHMVVVGAAQEQGEVPRFFISKFDGEGQILWETMLGPTDFYKHIFEDVTIATDGHYVASEASYRVGGNVKRDNEIVTFY
jgi:hypothetical protein